MNEKNKYVVTVWANNKKYTFGDWDDGLTDDGLGAEQLWQGMSELVPITELLPWEEHETFEDMLKKLPDGEDSAPILESFWEPHETTWDDLPDNDLKELLDAAVKAEFIDDYEIEETDEK